jgi:hypothetical protein
MNILTEGKVLLSKIKGKFYATKSPGGVFFGKSLKFIGYLSILGLLAGVSLPLPPPVSGSCWMPAGAFSWAIRGM